MPAFKDRAVEVVECHAPLFSDAREKVAAASTKRGALRHGLRALGAWAKLARGFFTAGKRDVVVVGYTGHLDLYLARALSVIWRRWETQHYVMRGSCSKKFVYYMQLIHV